MVMRIRMRECFFDRKAVIAALNPVVRRNLSRFGAFTRTTAKQSIKTKDGPAPAGSPPHSHVGTLKRGIQFAYDKMAASVVVGPEPFGSATAPSLLEYGGRVNKRVRKITKKKLGESGIIAIGKSRSSRRWRGDGRTEVTFVKLKTQKMVNHSNQLLEQLSVQSRNGSMSARPYMGPAFTKELSKLPSMWQYAGK